MQTLSEIKTNDPQLFSASTLPQSGKELSVSEKDESQAAIELLRLIVALSSGQLTGEMLQSQENETGAAPGPLRDEVELLKEVIRRIRSGNDSFLKSEKNAASGQNDPPSLQSLLESLPPELRELLARAFPDLNELLMQEQEFLAEQATDQTDEIQSSAENNDLSDTAAQAIFWRQMKNEADS